MENRSYFRIRKCSEKEAVFRNVLEKAVRKLIFRSNLE